MLELLKCITSGFWVFVGSVILVSVTSWLLNAVLTFFSLPTHAELKALRSLDKTINHATEGLNNPHIGEDTKQKLTKKLEDATLTKTTRYITEAIRKKG